MSIKGAAVLAVATSSALGGERANSSSVENQPTGGAAARSASSKLNVLLGGAMLSGVILVVFLICYCCHRNMRKSGRSSQYWQDEPEVPLEVFTVDGQCYEVAGVFLAADSCASFEALTCPQTPSPPPPYDSVVSEKATEEVKQPLEDNSGLPSYEAALRLEAQGYV